MAVDLLYTGGPVFTGAGRPLQGVAVAVEAGRIAAVVPERDAGGIVGPETEIVDLAGALLAPGFQDAHIHAVGGGVELLQCDLTRTASADEAVAEIAAYAERTAPADGEPGWIVGAGWSMDHFPGGAPLRGLIDAVVADRPVLLESRDHHSAWANTAAIRAAGIDTSTPDPADGRIERDADGFPSGTFHEGAVGLFGGVRPETSDELAYRGLLRAQEELLALGITGWQDAMVGNDGPGAGAIEAYERGIAEGTLRVHVVGAQWWDRDRGLEQIERMLERRDARAASGERDRFDLGTVKIMVDGVAENFTASMLTPYRDADGHDTCNHGISFIDAEVLGEAVSRLDAAGMQVHFHALGDRAVRDALDAVAGARAANGASDGRHHLAHLQVVAEVDAPRFAEVDATANLQMLWATHEEQIDTLTLPFMQEGQEARQYPFGDLVRGGARIAAGSDWPVSSADPLAAIQIAVTRIAPGLEADPLGGAHQRLPLEVALAAYTSGTAYVNHRDHDTGWVREGYLANLVVIEPDPFGLSDDELHRARVRETRVSGELVFTAPTAD
ncbi:amidohydrolase [Leucobacter zeae]|nr:amidohydrolase [Leucobacter zeae]